MICCLHCRRQTYSMTIATMTRMGKRTVRMQAAMDTARSTWWVRCRSEFQPPPATSALLRGQRSPNSTSHHRPCRTHAGMSYTHSWAPCNPPPVILCLRAKPPCNRSARIRVLNCFVNYPMNGRNQLCRCLYTGMNGDFLKHSR